jgi:N-acetylmuramoyl-L-alanine amidase
MERVSRFLLYVMALLGLVAAPVAAEHSPHFDVTCPTGTAHVVLDPGHGGSDPGAVHTGPNLVERDLTLEIALEVARIVEHETGATVALTRETNEEELGNSERGEIANACGAIVFVEIHLNAASDPEINRAQSFWGDKEKDLALSVVMNNALASLGIPVADVDRFDNGGLLRARMPSVLVEAAFLTNDDEVKRLANGEREDDIANAIADGIVSWIGMVGLRDAHQGKNGT